MECVSSPVEQIGPSSLALSPLVLLAQLENAADPERGPALGNATSTKQSEELAESERAKDVRTLAAPSKRDKTYRNASDSLTRDESSIAFESLSGSSSFQASGVESFNSRIEILGDHLLGMCAIEEQKEKEKGELKPVDVENEDARESESCKMTLRSRQKKKSCLKTKPSDTPVSFSLANAQVLVKWSVCVSQSGSAFLEGILDGQPWRTCSVAERIDNRHLKTKSGKVYHLKGPNDVAAMTECNFDRKLIQAFRNGFPSDWRKLVQQYYQNEEGEEEDKEKKQKRIRSPTSGLRQTAPVEAADSEPERTTTRSGRPVARPAYFWLTTPAKKTPKDSEKVLIKKEEGVAKRVGRKGRGKATAAKRTAKEKPKEIRDNIEKEWTDEEMRRYNRAMFSLKPGTTRFWERVSALVQTRSAYECEQFKSALFPSLKAKSDGETKKSKERRDVADIFSHLGGDGTMKRRQQMRELIGRLDEGHNDDPFGGTPFRTVMEPKVGLDSGEDRCIGLIPVTPRTPVGSELTPLKQFDWNVTDRYLFQLERKRRKKPKDGREPPKKKSSKASGNEPIVQLTRILAGTSKKFNSTPSDVTSSDSDSDSEDDE
ncbi:uncharacterized protein [Oscarella lobularis]|uniref:uncharacterized protein isoform X2 n=1 Tax=Oscarella lobularis TaxID=121494 RepID=UPI0033131BAF